MSAAPENLRPSFTDLSRHEGRARGQANHLWLHWSQPRRDAVCFNAQAEPERGSGAGLARASLWYRSFWRARQQLPCPESHAGAHWQAAREVCRRSWSFPARNGWLWHLQNLWRPFPFTGKTRRHDSGRDSEREFMQDPLRRGIQENHGHRRWKKA